MSKNLINPYEDLGDKEMRQNSSKRIHAHNQMSSFKNVPLGFTRQIEPIKVTVGIRLSHLPCGFTSIGPVFLRILGQGLIERKSITFPSIFLASNFAAPRLHLLIMMLSVVVPRGLRCLAKRVWFFLWFMQFCINLFLYVRLLPPFSVFLLLVPATKMLEF